MRIKLFSRDDPRSEQICIDLSKKLVTFGFSIDEKNPEAVIFVGGDGTFLRAVQQYIKLIDKVVFLGVHSGTLGFFCAYSENEVSTIANDLKNHSLLLQKHRLLFLKRHFDVKIDEQLAVNEVRVENPFHTLATKVLVDGQMLETFRGNGLIVSSSLGSSAYNKSLGGSLVDTSLDTLQLTEVATIQNNAYRSLGSSLVLAPERTIVFEGDFHQAVVGFDHVVLDNTQTMKKIEIGLSKLQVSLVFPKNRIYVNTLRKSFINERNGD